MPACRVEWRYSGAQSAVDEKAGVDGLTPRRAKEIEGLRLALEAELREKEGRVYELAGEKIPARPCDPIHPHRRISPGCQHLPGRAKTSVTASKADGLFLVLAAAAVIAIVNVVRVQSAKAVAAKG